MSYLVAHRVWEIGVRIALGATPGDLTRLTIEQAAVSLRPVGRSALWLLSH
jgi:hypothetical protein